MWTLADAAGGVALLIFGVRFLRKGLDRLLGDRVETWLSRLAGGPFRAAMFGLLIGLAVPSSTTLSLLTVAQVRQRRLTMKQSLALLLGSSVGITLLVYLVAFNFHNHASVPLVLGVAMFMGLRRERLRGIGQIVLSLGFILLGASLLKSAAAIASTWPDLGTLAGVFSRYPWLAALFGAAVTVLLQSSTATVAATMSLSVLMHPALALPVLIGANVGISLTTLIVGWTDRDARALGWGLVLLRAAVGSMLLLCLDLFGLPAATASLDLSRVLALSHTGFNVLALLLGLLALTPVAAMCSAMVPSTSEREDDQHRVVYLDPRWGDEPQVALSQSKREIARMAALVTRMLQAFWKALKSGDESAARSLNLHDDLVDRINGAVKLFLTRDLADGLSDRQDAARVAQLRFLSALETVGDIIEGDLADIAIKKSTRGLDFSPEGWGELERFYTQVAENLEIATAAFVENDPALARKLLRHEESIRDQEQRLALSHFGRLQTGQRRAMDTTDLHLELLIHLKHINHLLTGVAYGVLEAVEAQNRPERPTLAAG